MEDEAIGESLLALCTKSDFKLELAQLIGIDVFYQIEPDIIKTIERYAKK